MQNNNNKGYTLCVGYERPDVPVIAKVYRETLEQALKYYAGREVSGYKAREATDSEIAAYERFWNAHEEGDVPDEHRMATCPKCKSA